MSKTHRGVRAQFSLLTRDDPQISHDHALFLAHGYEIKSWADYGTGPQGEHIPIEATERFIEAIQGLLV